MSTITVTIAGGSPADYPTGTPLADIIETPQGNGFPVLGARVNNEARSLAQPLTVNSTVELLTSADADGWRIYRRTLTFLLAKVVHQRFPAGQFRVQHSLGPGLYCTLSLPGYSNGDACHEHLEQLTADLKAVIAADCPIECRQVAYMDALHHLERAGQTDKLNLLRHRNPPHVHVHHCDGFYDLAHGPLAARTGILATFDLISYPPGFVLRLPTQEAPDRLEPFEPQPHLFNIYQEHAEWGRILGLTTVGQLNQSVLNKEIEQFIQTAEALHDKKLANIAQQITTRTPRPKLILIAGPSSAGKTTSAKRLTTHLRVNGLRPCVLGTDDYFVGEARNPVDEHGKPDYEHIEALDLEALNRDLEALLAGGTIKRRRFDFVTKSPVITEQTLTVGADDILIMEGIHGLNPRLTAQVPRDQKFLIYISALTQLGIDNNNRISTTDNRLLRRIVRDNQFRGHSALRTLDLWPSVRRGEQRWIFPFQDQADATFNSALDYELAVLRTYAEPLLCQIKPDCPEYAEARRLTGFLHNFLEIPAHFVPGYSILREYIGGSRLHY